MGDWYAGIGGNGDGRRDTWYDFERDSGSGHRLGLLSPTPEDERIAAFQPHHHVSRLCAFDKQPVDFRLVLILTASPPSHVNALGSRWRMVQQRGVREIIVQDEIR